MSKTVLITGGVGFIGSNFMPYFCARYSEYNIINMLNEKRPRVDDRMYEEQIAFVEARVGHDLRYVIDATKLETEMRWKAEETFDTGIVKTVEWCL